MGQLFNSDSLGNSAEVDKEKMNNYLREAEQRRLAEKVTKGQSSLLQNLGGKLGGLFEAKSTSNFESKSPKLVKKSV